MPDMNPRSCIVSREEKSPDDLVRFVLDPSGTVVPDLKRKLPGRGAWVSLDRGKLEEAMKKNLFSKAFKQQVTVDSDLGDRVDHLLEREALGLLAMARKAGNAITGFMKVENSIRTGDIAVLIHASDAKADGKGKLAQALRVCEMDDVMTIDCFSGVVLDQYLGNDNTVHVALTNGGLARNFQKVAGRLLQYRGGIGVE